MRGKKTRREFDSPHASPRDENRISKRERKRERERTKGEDGWRNNICSR